MQAVQGLGGKDAFDSPTEHTPKQSQRMAPVSTRMLTRDMREGGGSVSGTGGPPPLPPRCTSKVR